MKKKQGEIVIGKDEAVFWLDKNGYWQNAHGKFRHKKIIDYFHASIRKDQNGYYLYQERDNLREKVYFHYEDTALFAVDLIKDNNNIITLILNTQKQVRLRPRNLFTRNDYLYMRLGPETIKFTGRGLMKISDLMEFNDEQYFIKVKNRRYRIVENKPR